MWPPQAWRVPSAAPRDEAAPPQAGLHPGVARLDPLRFQQPFMTVPHVEIEGLLSIQPHALFDNGQGSMPRTGPLRATVELTIMALGSEYGVQWHCVCPEPLRIAAPWSPCLGRPWPWRLPLEASSPALSRARETVPFNRLPEGGRPAGLARSHADSSWAHNALCWG